jgi:L-ornithine N5-oxygenase
MSPHALSVSDSDSVRSESVGSDSRPDLEGVPESLLQRFPDNEVHDLVCVGFGPASLAIAVALHDALDLNASKLSTRTPKVRFLEKQEQFAWHAGMLLPGAKMQITFVKDMATLRNPRSEYTFLNYLHQNNRLVDFTNLGTFLPQRIEYEDYMRWCAAHFSAVADYSQDVQKIEIGKVNPATGSIENFQISSVDHRTSRLTKLYAKNVIIAAGGRPNIPKPLPEYHPRILHSSQYATRVHKLFPEGTSPKKVVVIGGGQSAAEVWYNIPERFPGAQSLLVIRGAALKPSDDSPL